MLNRNIFFRRVKVSLFPKGYTQNQVNGLNFILDGWEYSGLKDRRWLAYMLATVYHETNKTFQPIKELGSLKYLRNKKYWPYYGRGYVQLTWDYNYKKMQDAWNSVHSDEQIDMIKNPDLAQSPRIALFVMFEGMTIGVTKHPDFTAYGLEDFFNDKLTDWEGARKIINGTDKKKVIAEYAKNFYEAIRYAYDERKG